MKLKEISATISAVIPTGDFANYRPSYTMSADLCENDNAKNCIDVLREQITDLLRQDWTRLRDKDKMDFLKKVRFYEKAGKKNPSVTSILAWSEFLYKLRNADKFQFGGVTEDELEQYGARGTIVHKAVEHWFNTKTEEKDGEWKTTFAETKIEELLVRDSKLSVDDCNWLGFWEKYGNKIEIQAMEKVVHGNGYSGKLDMYGTWEKKPAVFDVKTTSTYTARVEMKYYKQLAAYANALKGKKKVEVLVIIPLNPSNKSGFGAPKVAKFTKELFNSFQKDLQQFEQDFAGLY